LSPHSELKLPGTPQKLQQRTAAEVKHWALAKARGGYRLSMAKPTALPRRRARTLERPAGVCIAWQACGDGPRIGLPPLA
jgi:hypothetical protein